MKTSSYENRETNIEWKTVITGYQCRDPQRGIHTIKNIQAYQNILPIWPNDR